MRAIVVPSEAGVAQKAAADQIGGEVGLGGLARVAGGAGVVAADGGERRHRLFRVAEGMHAWPGGYVRREARVLDDDRLAAREVGGAAGAEPAAARGHV